MIAIIHRTYHKPKMINGSTHSYICRIKFNIFPTTLPRISGIPRRYSDYPDAYTIYYLINRINDFIRKHYNIPIHHMRKNHIKPTNFIPHT